MNHQPEANDSERVLILLCTYNEAGNLPRMFELLSQHVPNADILVVDDSSPDGTAKIVEQHAANDPRYNLLLRPGKEGLGTATRSGLQWGVDREYDLIVNLDADLSHQPVVIPSFLDACRQGADVAVGSRYIKGGGLEGLSPHRRLISRVLNGYATRLLRLPITDCSGSFRCYQLSALKSIDLGALKCSGYGFLEEILVALMRSGAKFAEVPIRFDMRFHGKSKLSMKDALGAIKVIHRLAITKSN